MKSWSNCPQNRAKNKEMEDGRELIKTSLEGQHGHCRVPEREKGENEGKEMSQEIVQKDINFHTEKAHWVLNTVEENTPRSRHIPDIPEPGSRDYPKNFQRENSSHLKDQKSEWV